MAVETKVTLFSKTLEDIEPGTGSVEYSISHAEKILANTDNRLGDWELRDDKFTVSNGVIKLADTGKDQNTKPKRATT